MTDTRLNAMSNLNCDCTCKGKFFRLNIFDLCTERSSYCFRQNRTASNGQLFQTTEQQQPMPSPQPERNGCIIYLPPSVLRTENWWCILKNIPFEEILLMFQKSSLGNSESFRCCFCFHVRTGTIILGIWHLVLHVLALALLFSVLVHPEVRNRFSPWTPSGTAVPDSSSHGMAPEYYSPQLPDLSAGPAANYAFGREKWQLQDVHVALAITCCTGVITLFLLYGTIRGRAKYLMPFFSLQVFDFIISALTAFGYFTYVPDIRRLFEEATDMPFQKELLRLDPEWLCAIVMIAVVLCMMLKAYFMGVVWSCYKYLKLLQVAQIVDTYIETDSEALLPPDYDTATKMPPHAALYAPPPYAATSNGV